ncbi:MAG: M20/M25/M40 family metallo-hydrolase [Bryobacterales bacterium]|nr:M20/M25/M40 family metallo-hydrolase [Bryobacterales bacterium]
MSIPRRQLFRSPAMLPLLSLGGSSRADATPSLARDYQEAAGRIIGACLADTDGMEKLIHLCDRIGNRLAGSESLNRAVTWAAEIMRADGLQNVATPLVKVPVWIRGQEWAKLLLPEERSLPMLGLGGSVGTPADGITADVVVVPDFDALDALGRPGVEGKIVLYNAAYAGYGNTVRYRSSGASRAAEYGALAALVRSVTPVSLQSPHTGALRYTVDTQRIPAAAITVEDAERMARLQARGVPLRVHLRMEARTAPDADSANVVGEIPGSASPNEIVVMGGHIDSWDVGQGAQDDGSGCLAAMQALANIRKLELRPRRTLRVCLWTNEENGLRGGNAYRAWSESRGEKHVAAIEMDGGAERPVGFGLGIRSQNAAPDNHLAKAIARLKQVGTLLDGIHAGEITTGGGGADIGPLMSAGVPGLGLRTVGEKYFHWHHTHADTVDKVDLQDFRACMAAMGVMGFVLADMPDTLLSL